MRNYCKQIPLFARTTHSTAIPFMSTMNIFSRGFSRDLFTYFAFVGFAGCEEPCSCYCHGYWYWMKSSSNPPTINLNINECECTLYCRYRNQHSSSLVPPPTTPTTPHPWTINWICIFQYSPLLWYWMAIHFTRKGQIKQEGLKQNIKQKLFIKINFL